MQNSKYVFGPVPSRRLGASLGVSPIPEKTCNYSCIYCQLGRTTKMTDKRKNFFPVEDILNELKCAIEKGTAFDVVSIVGEGEPTLYSRLGELITGIKMLTDKPVAVITNGALLTDEQVRDELMNADIVLPSLDAYDAASFKIIDRPHGSLSYDEIFQGLVTFSKEYKGRLWLEIMLVEGINTTDEALFALADLAAQVSHERLYINTPVRPPAESFAIAANEEVIKKASKLMDGISIDLLTSGSFVSSETDSFEAVLSIARRHPMNRFEIESFLSARGEEAADSIFTRLAADPRVTVLNYKGIMTYRVN